MNEETKEYTMDDLEDIIREYSSRRLPELPKEEKVGSDTVRLEKPGSDTVRFGASAGDTVRLDRVGSSKPSTDTKLLPDIDEDVRVYQPAKKKKPDDAPKPEKYQKPIDFPNKKQAKPVLDAWKDDPAHDPQAGQKRLKRLQTGLMLHLALLLLASASALCAYQAEGLLLKWMVAVQLLILLLSAGLGFRRLADGVEALRQRGFRLSSLLVFSFALCCLDGLLCLSSQNIPFGAVFALQMLLAQWGEYQKHQTQMSQLDTLRKATDLTAVVKTEQYFKGQPAYQTVEGSAEAFVKHYREEVGPEKSMHRYAWGIVVLGAVLAVITVVLHGFVAGLRVYAAALLAAVPASSFVSIQRPAAILEKRMHKLGTVLCGWHGLQNIEKHGFYPLGHKDLFPDNHVKLNGVRFYGERNVSTIVSYVSALMAADGGALAQPFEQLRDSRNARVCRVEELTSYPDGIGGQIDGLSVVAGTLEFMENMGVSLPDGARIPYGVYAAVNQSLCAVFAVSFTRSKSSASGLRTLCDSSYVRPILVDCDYILTEQFLEEKLGVDAHRMKFPDCMTRMKLAQKQPSAGATAIALVTRGGLAQRAYAITGGAALRSAWRAGVAVHVLGGGIGFVAVAALALKGALFLLTPYNLLLYGCVWMIPGLLMAEWTRSV